MAKPKLHIMVDTETFSSDVRHGLVLTVAFVPFTLKIDEELPRDVHPQMIYFDMDDSIRHGRQIDQKTLAWWHTPAKKVQYMSMMAAHDKMKMSFMGGWAFAHSYLAELAKKYTLIMWSRGTDFDFPIIESSMCDAGIVAPLPYRFYHKYDVRTVTMLAEDVAGIKKVQVLPVHDAFEDCNKQIQDVKLALLNMGLWDLQR